MCLPAMTRLHVPQLTVSHHKKKYCIAVNIL